MLPFVFISFISLFENIQIISSLQIKNRIQKRSNDDENLEETLRGKDIALIFNSIPII